MHSDKGWKVTSMGNVESPQDSAAEGRELWEAILAAVPLRFIPLVCCEDCAQVHNERVYLSDGTICLHRPENDKVKYNGEAFLPKTPWRVPTDWERKRLWQNAGITDVDFVGIARIPNELLANLSDDPGDTDKGALWQLELRRIKELIGPLVDYLCDRFAYKSEPINHGIALNPPGLETVTFDPTNRKFLGLHLDSWDGLPLKTRARSLNRICVNIGAEPRHFLFLNLSLMNIAQVLAQQTPDTCRALNWLGPAFMSRFPGYPIVKVRIDPGEAYIAPTDNVVHDASTSDSPGPSVNLTLRGRFSVPAVQARTAQSCPARLS